MDHFFVLLSAISSSIVSILMLPPLYSASLLKMFYEQKRYQCWNLLSIEYYYLPTRIYISNYMLVFIFNFITNYVKTLESILKQVNCEFIVNGKTLYFITRPPTHPSFSHPFFYFPFHFPSLLGCPDFVFLCVLPLHRPPVYFSHKIVSLNKWPISHLTCMYWGILSLMILGVEIWYAGLSL